MKDLIVSLRQTAFKATMTPTGSDSGLRLQLQRLAETLEGQANALERWVQQS